MGLSATHALGWGYRYHVPCDGARDVRFNRGGGTALAALIKQRRPFRLLDYERSLARAWVAAGQGAVSEAITVLLSAAKRASAKGQFAAEVVCLQTAAQFGDRSGSLRLRDLEAIVEGPRVGVAARFSAALSDGDAAELAAVSEEFERMGDRTCCCSMPLPKPPSRIAARACGDRRWDARHAQIHWPNNVAVHGLRRFVRPANPCR